MSRDALVVGINTYQSDNLPNLQSPAEDAEAIAQLLEKHGGFRVRRLPEFLDPFDGNARRVAHNQEAVLVQLEEALVQLFKPEGKSTPETALFFFSGHGLRKDRGVQEGFLATSDSDPEHGNWGLSLQWLRRLLQVSPVKQQVIWLDCCYSGEFLNFEEADPGDRGKHRDRCFIAASREFEVAYVSPHSPHSILTQALLQGLEPTRLPNRWIDNFVLADYINQSLKPALQTPICNNSGEPINLTRNWALPDKLPKNGGELRLTTCPYKGLAYFDCNEADPQYFYGRTALTDTLIDRVRKGSFLAIIGSSGSGKSSVLRAGLLYQLKQGRRLVGSDEWSIHIFRPGEHPLQSLAMSFLDLALPDIERATQLGQVEQLISEGANGLRRLVQSSTARRVVVVVDQFEECFTLCQTETERKQFFQSLLDALEQVGERKGYSALLVVIAMRADFFNKCLEQDYSGLAEKIQQNLVAVTPMTPEELQLAITKPAEQVGLEIEPELVSQMIRDVEGSPGNLPLLQYTLTELWKQRTDDCLRLTAYTHLGGVMGTLQKRASDVYQQLAPAEQATAKYIFLSLTQLGEGTEDTRRQVLKRDLVTSQYPELLIDQVIQKLTDEKLLVTSELVEKGAKPRRAAVVDVVHEALIRYWTELRQWLNETRDALRKQRDIEQDAKDWQERGEPMDYLLQGLKLAEAEDFLERYAATVPLSNRACQFIQVSQLERDKRLKAEEERRKREINQARQIAIGATAATVVLTGLTVFSVIQLRKAEIEQIKTAIALSEANLALNQGIDARITSVRAGKTLQQSFWQNVWPETELRSQVLVELQKTGYGVQELNRFEGHRSRALSVAYSPDGTQLATSGEDGTVRLWDMTGKQLIELQGHQGWVWSVAYSPDGTKLAASGGDGTVRLWSTSGKALAILKGHRGKVYSVTYSPDGTKLATSGGDGTVRLWSTSGKALAILKGHRGKVYSVTYSPDGTKLATSGEDGTVRLWSTSGKVLAILKDHQSSVTSVAFSRNNAQLATGGEDGRVFLWSASGKTLATFKAHQSSVNSISFSPDSTKLATGGDDSTARVWDLSGNQLSEFKGHRGWVWSVAFSPDGNKLVTSGDDNVRLWDLSSYQQSILRGHQGAIFSIAFSPDGTKLVTGGEDGIARLWSSSGKQLAELKGHQDKIKGVAFSPDGTKLLTGADDGTARLWNTSGKQLIEIKEPQGKVLSVAFSPDRTKLATGSENGTVHIWNTSGQQLAELKGQYDSVLTVAFSPDGTKVVAGGLGSTVYLWEISGQKLAEIKGHVGSVNDATFSPDGTKLATAGDDGTVRLWDLLGNQLAEFKGHQGWVWSVAFSPSGIKLVTSGPDGAVRLWDLLGNQLAEFKGHQGSINDAIFSPDGTKLATGGDDGTARLWNISDEGLSEFKNLTELIAKNCNQLGDYLTTNFNAGSNHSLCKQIQ